MWNSVAKVGISKFKRLQRNWDFCLCAILNGQGIEWLQRVAQTLAALRHKFRLIWNDQKIYPRSAQCKALVPGGCQWHNLMDGGGRVETPLSPHLSPLTVGALVAKDNPFISEPNYQVCAQNFRFPSKASYMYISISKVTQNVTVSC